MPQTDSTAQYSWCQRLVPSGWAARFKEEAGAVWWVPTGDKRVEYTTGGDQMAESHPNNSGLYFRTAHLTVYGSGFSATTEQSRN